MLWYKDEPDEGDFVVVNITDVEKNSVYADLEEYEDETGLIHISELTRSWIQDASEVVSEGEKEVAQVVEIDDGSVSLSLKRVNDSKKKEVMERWNKEQKVEDFVEEIQSKKDMSRSDILEEIIFPLQKELGSSFKGFEEANGREQKIVDIIGEENTNVVQEVAKEQINLRQEKLEAVVKVSFNQGDGIKRIHEVFEKVPEGVDASYMSAPEYQITAWGRNSELAKKRINKFKNQARKVVQNKNGNFEFVKE